MSEVKIARFVDIKACKSIFSKKSTFILRSPEHYIRLYETGEGETGKGDRDEGCADILGGGTAGYKCWVASCWTKLEGDEPTSDEWNIFKENDQNVVAIISTPSKVCKFLDKSLDTDKEGANRSFPFHPVNHRGVNYGKMPHFDSTKFKDVPFWKGTKFIMQKEYRFILECERSPVIDSLIFCGGIDYMEQCFVNPTMCKQKEELQDIIQKAGAYYGDFHGKEPCDIIANVDYLF